LGAAAVDGIDYRILRELQFNARITNAQLAEKVAISPSACWNRVRNLEKQGVIENYVTIFNQTALGMPDTVVVEVTLDKHDDQALARFENALAHLPEVVEAYLITGDYDYYIKAAVAGTAGYEEFLREKLYKIPGIRHTRTSFALRCLKRTFSVQIQR
jgi:Lrp/AsnC family transcriptional regulator, leucine-responsive regulatory protein